MVTGDVMRRYIPLLPRVVDVYDHTVVPLLLKCLFARLASSVFLGVSGYVSIQAEEPPIRQIPIRPNETFTAAAGDGI